MGRRSFRASAWCLETTSPSGAAPRQSARAADSPITVAPARCWPENEARRQRGLKLFVLPPRSPQLNGAVERAQRTHTEEFYAIASSSFQIAQLNRELRAWERTYNTIRPHQALGYRTPQEFLTQRVSPSQLNECH